MNDKPALIRIVAALLVSAACIALPFGATAVVNDWLVSAASLVIIAVSWNLAANAGLISLGHSAFWGIGSYAAILAANKLGLGLAASLLPALLLGAAVGAALAVITGRLRGIFFAISTLALSEGLRVLAVMLPGLTGGGEGMYLDPKLRPAPEVVAAFMAFGALAAVWLAWAMSRTPWHFAFRAMRANESAAQMLGVQPVRFRVGVLALAGAMASFAGGVRVWYGGFIDPGIAFDLHITILAQIAPILGGIHTLAGPVIGAFLGVLLSEGARIWLGDKGVSLLVYGVALVLCILFLPQGVWGGMRAAWARWARRSENRT
ncbi:MAG: branched-chain amino acid ABC transporter permease [Burkholderiaceae bacterium]|nr:branched-chain amino acid ABC transporter permease [Burkholderiaceae bacterium]